MPTEAQQKAWMDQWRRASEALRAQRFAEIRGLSDADALAAADSLLSIGGLGPISESRRTSSGLTRQQALFHGRAAR